MLEQLLSKPIIPLATFVVLAIAGLSAGRLVKFFKIPEISGQILAGILLGSSVLGIFSEHALSEVKMITELALGVMTFIAGTHLSFKKLHNARKRLFSIAFFDIFLTFWTVFLLLSLFTGLNLPVRLLLASIAIATAPGTVVGLVQAKKARGAMVKTLIGVVALNNVAAVIAFEICKIISIEIFSPDLFNALEFFWTSTLSFIADLGIGFLGGWIIAQIMKHQHEDSALFSSIFLAIASNVVICQYFPLSNLLVNMAAGVTLSNLSYHSRRISHLLDSFNGLLFAVFFTLAGTHLNLGLLTVAGFAGIIYVVSRGAAKIMAVYGAGKIFAHPPKITKYLGMGLIPQAGLAIGLVISLNEFEVFVESGLSATVATIALAAVVINEIIGPYTTAKSFDLAKESKQALPRLIDFLHEEYIMMPLNANDKWDAIEKICRFLVKTNHLRSIKFEDLYQSVVEREKSFSTGLGNRLAIPHARIPAKEQLMGVIGITKKPIDFDSIDGEKVNIIILIATPKGKEDLHLKIIATIAKIFTEDPTFHDKLANAENPAEAYDLLQSKEVQEINYFLDENL